MLQVNNVTFSFAAQKVLHQCNVSVPTGKTLSILGKSGCGKTTLLKAIAGLIEIETGEIWFNQENLSFMAAQERRAVYLYQEALLFPHLNVFENVAFGLRLKHLSEAEIKAQTHQMLAFLQIEDQAYKFGHQLSGGQRQRVSFGRALILKPRLLLLDEPFAALDAQIRGQMQTFFRAIVAEHQITTIFVTHDVKEALQVGDCFGYMQAGKIEFFDTQTDFAASPKSGIASEKEFWKNI